MIPNDLKTTTVRMNAQALLQILSLAYDSVKLKKHMLKNYVKSDDAFDRTIDAIHAINLTKELSFYENLILELQGSLVEKGISLC